MRSGPCHRRVRSARRAARRAAASGSLADRHWHEYHTRAAWQPRRPTPVPAPVALSSGTLRSRTLRSATLRISAAEHSVPSAKCRRTSAAAALLCRLRRAARVGGRAEPGAPYRETCTGPPHGGPAIPDSKRLTGHWPKPGRTAAATRSWRAARAGMGRSLSSSRGSAAGRCQLARNSPPCHGRPAQAITRGRCGFIQGGSAARRWSTRNDRFGRAFPLTVKNALDRTSPVSRPARRTGPARCSRHRSFRRLRLIAPRLHEGADVPHRLAQPVRILHQRDAHEPLAVLA